MYVCVLVVENVSHIPISDDIEKPQCVLCHVVLCAESMKPSKLERHLETQHPEHAKKDFDFFKQHERCSHNGGII